MPCTFRACARSRSRPPPLAWEVHVWRRGPRSRKYRVHIGPSLDQSNSQCLAGIFLHPPKKTKNSSRFSCWSKILWFLYLCICVNLNIKERGEDVNVQIQCICLFWIYTKKIDWSSDINFFFSISFSLKGTICYVIFILCKYMLQPKISLDDWRIGKNEGLQKSGRCIRITFLDSLSSIFLDLPRGTRPRLGILFYFISPPAPSLYNRIERLETRIPAIHRGGTARHRE